MTLPNIVDDVRVELSAHKAVAAGVATFVAVVGETVTLGVLHGTWLHVAQVVLGAASVLGISGAVYQTKAATTVVRNAPQPGPALDPSDDSTPSGDWVSP